MTRLDGTFHGKTLLRVAESFPSGVPLCSWREDPELESDNAVAHLRRWLQGDDTALDDWLADQRLTHAPVPEFLTGRAGEFEPPHKAWKARHEWLEPTKLRRAEGRGPGCSRRHLILCIGQGEEETYGASVD